MTLPRPRMDLPTTVKYPNCRCYSGKQPFLEPRATATATEPTAPLSLPREGGCSPEAATDKLVSASTAAQAAWKQSQTVPQDFAYDTISDQQAGMAMGSMSGLQQSLLLLMDCHPRLQQDSALKQACITQVSLSHNLCAVSRDLSRLSARMSPPLPRQQ